MTPAELASILEREHGILTRAGLHCAPLAHQTMSTADTGGATRLSLGPFLTEDDVRAVIEAIGSICRANAPVPQP